MRHHSCALFFTVFLTFALLFATAPEALAQVDPEGEEAATEAIDEEDELAPSPGFIVPGEEEVPPEATAKEEAAKEEAPAKEAPKAETTEKKGEIVILRKEGQSLGSSPYTVLGASTLGEDGAAIRMAFGYPEIQAFYQFALAKQLDISIGGGFFYGLNPKTAGDVMGAAALFEARWRFWEDGPHTLSLTASPALYGIFDPDAAFGLILGLPGITYDFEIAGRHHAILGFNSPWGFYFHDSGVSARVPLLFKMAMEFAVSDAIHVFVSSEIGADIWAGDYIDDTFLYVRALGGASFSL